MSVTYLKSVKSLLTEKELEQLEADLAFANFVGKYLDGVSDGMQLLLAKHCMCNVRQPQLFAEVVQQELARRQ